MAKTVLALYRHAPQARGAITDLIGRGLHPNDISVVTAARASGALSDIPLEALELADTGGIGVRGPLLGILKASHAGRGGGLADLLRGAGIPDPDNRLYSEGVRRGGTLVLATVPTGLADAAADALDAHSPEDPEEFGAPAEEEAVVDAAPASEPNAGPEVVERAAERPVRDERIAEEDLEPGRREVDHGGVVVAREVSEIPVEEPVEVAVNHVEVERRPAERPATEADFRAFEPGEMVFVETAEQVVVTKVPYVVEELVIQKKREKRRELVRDSIRRSEVRIVPRRG